MIAGDEENLACLLEARRLQVELHGHTALRDLAKPPHQLAETARTFVGMAADVLHPGERQNLDVAMKRLARAGAMILATMARIRSEQEVVTALAATEWPLP